MALGAAARTAGLVVVFEPDHVHIQYAAAGALPESLWS
jgi:hypothetical protein